MIKLKDIVLIKAFRTHWKDGFYWFAYNILFGLLPVWGVLILQIAFSIQPAYLDFFSHGEFALYSAALSAGTLFTVWLDRKMRFWGYSRFFALLSVLGLILSTLIFAGIFAATSQPPKIMQIDPNFLRDFTLWLYIGTVIISLAAVLIDLYRVAIDPRGIAASQFDELKQSFDELGNKEGVK